MAVVTRWLRAPLRNTARFPAPKVEKYVLYTVIHISAIFQVIAKKPPQLYKVPCEEI
jgi:hypothetical protein